MKTRAGKQVHGRSAENAPAFTRVELAAVLGGLGLLALVALPALAGNRERSARVLCVNNLRLIGQAYAQWGTEHGGRTPIRTFWFDGGLQGGGSAPPGTTAPPWYSAGFQNNVWFQWSWISNELRTPKILACPSDVEKVPARGWGGNPDGGFVHVNYRDRAASYLISLDVLPQSPLALLSGDRNLRYTSVIGTCSSGVAPCRSLILSQPDTLGIAGGLHAEQGNYLLTDGRVEELSSRGFLRRMLEIYPIDDSGSIHYIAP